MMMIDVPVQYGGDIIGYIRSRYILNKREILSVACGIQAFEGSVSS